jgi:transcriptional regulator with XRE-family HTH domain
MTLEDLAEEASTSAAHLSRVERDERHHLSPDLRDRLAALLELPAEAVLRADRRLPSAIASELADPAFASVFMVEGRIAQRARSALRRANLALIAEAEFGAGTAIADLDAALLSRGLASAEAPEAAPELRLEPPIVWVRRGLARSRIRFARAHALAHAILEPVPACDWGAAEPAEAEATALASFILAPRPALGRAVRKAAARFEIDVWGRGAGDLIAAVAEELDLPGWLVARRACEEGFLAQEAEMADL